MDARRAWLLASTCLLIACGDGGPDAVHDPSGTFQSDCRVRFAMTTGELRSTFQAIFDYGRAPGHFVGVNTAVECTRLDERAGIVGANQCTGEDGACVAGDRPELYISTHTNRPIAAPLELLDCRFVGSAVPRVDDFDLIAVFATDEDLQPMEPPPLLEVASIECETTGSTTTTTVSDGDPCEALDCASDEACMDGACVATDLYRVEFRSDLAASFGALQISAHYDCTEGSFEGFGDAVSCATLPELNVFTAFHDHDCVAPATDASLAAGVISLVGWQGPGPYMACEYRSRSGEPPTGETFKVELVDATDLDGVQLPRVSVSVSSIRPLPPK